MCTVLNQLWGFPLHNPSCHSSWCGLKSFINTWSLLNMRNILYKKNTERDIYFQKITLFPATNLTIFCPFSTRVCKSILFTESYRELMFHSPTSSGSWWEDPLSASMQLWLPFPNHAVPAVHLGYTNQCCCTKGCAGNPIHPAAGTWEGLSVDT
jgi:hypothetical protein